ncbi:hypothetical protein NLI96_g4037 [Meripilus lineatus]|uniref:Uncharacterized protein n=1 Tax=Meripilus lineatus TaxID=2056292 RepID=A0AAD5YF58_9APHY|nr:hypothetical protein NLI96_g4037 [Physisporinus lineatus]
MAPVAYKQDEDTSSQLGGGQSKGQETTSTLLPEPLEAPSRNNRPRVAARWATHTLSLSSHLWAWSMLMADYLIAALSRLAPRLVNVYQQHLEYANQGPNKAAFDSFLSMADFQLKVIPYRSMIVFCFAAYNTFVVLYGIETGLFLEFCRVAIMPLAIGGIILPDSLRSHIVCYRGMSSQGIRRHISGSLVAFTLKAAAVEGLSRLA